MSENILVTYFLRTIFRGRPARFVETDSRDRDGRFFLFQGVACFVDLLVLLITGKAEPQSGEHQPFTAVFAITRHHTERPFQGREE